MLKQQCVANNVSPVVRRTFLLCKKFGDYRHFTKGGTKHLVRHEKWPYVQEFDHSHPSGGHIDLAIDILLFSRII